MLSLLNKTLLIPLFRSDSQAFLMQFEHLNGEQDIGILVILEHCSGDIELLVISIANRKCLVHIICIVVRLLSVLCCDSRMPQIEQEIDKKIQLLERFKANTNEMNVVTEELNFIEIKFREQLSTITFRRIEQGTYKKSYVCSVQCTDKGIPNQQS